MMAVIPSRIWKRRCSHTVRICWRIQVLSRPPLVVLCAQVKTNNKIAMMVLNLASAVETVLGWIAYFSKVAEPDFHVDIYTEYSVNSSPEELTALDAKTMGDLSQEDYLQELKRRGLLRNDFSLADNADRLSVELRV